MQGISTRRGIMNIHQEQAYAEDPHPPLPHSERARDGVILLPLYDSMTEHEQAYVIDALQDLASDINTREVQ